MNKFCQNCGNQLQGTETVCPKCGASLQQTQQPTMQQQVVRPQYQQPQMNYGGTSGYNIPAAGITNRSIVTAVILSIVTCGIYGIYWFVCLTNEANQASGDTNATSGGMALLFTILTCGIYSLYWCYKMGERMATAGQRYGKPIENRSLLYLILAIVGLGIVNYCLIQDDLNKLSA